jgi:hypothetical protein
MEFRKIQRIFESCLREAAVFERDGSGGQLFESDTIRRENKKWIAIAAGISRGEAQALFHANSSRAERATVPVRTLGIRGYASFLFVLRPMSFPIAQHDPTNQIAHFAPQDEIPLVELRDGFFRIRDLEENKNTVSTLRWELDAVQSRHDPLEPWLRRSASLLGYNPAHPPSHLHINSFGENEVGMAVEPAADLRLCVGVLNPLGLVLSFAACLRAN